MKNIFYLIINIKNKIFSNTQAKSKNSLYLLKLNLFKNKFFYLFSFILFFLILITIKNRFDTTFVIAGTEIFTSTIILYSLFLNKKAIFSLFTFFLIFCLIYYGPYLFLIYLIYIPFVSISTLVLKKILLNWYFFLPIFAFFMAFFIMFYTFPIDLLITRNFSYACSQILSGSFVNFIEGLINSSFIGLAFFPVKKIALDYKNYIIK